MQVGETRENRRIVTVAAIPVELDEGRKDALGVVARTRTVGRAGELEDLGGRSRRSRRRCDLHRWPFGRSVARELRHQHGQKIPQRPAWHDHVDHAVLQQHLSAPGVLWNRFRDGAFHDARADESDIGARLADEHVAERSEARERAAEARVGEDRHVQQTLGVMLRDGTRRLGHLHQRHHAFLNAGAATGQHRDDRQSLARRDVKRPGHFLADHRPHRAAHEVKLERNQDDRSTVETRLARQRRFVQAGALLGLTQPLPVRLRVAEAERVGRKESLADFLEAVGVREVGDPLVRGQRGVSAARRADAQVFLEGRLVGLVAAAGASNDRGTFGLGQGRRAGWSLTHGGCPSSATLLWLKLGIRD